MRLKTLLVSVVYFAWSISCWAKPLDPEMDRLVKELVTLVARERQQDPPKKILSSVSSKEELSRYIQSQVTRKITRDQILLDSWSVVALKMLSKPIDSVKLLKTFAGDNVAGFYDPTKKELALVDWVRPVQATPVLAHELTHFLQDQQLSLDQFISPTELKNLGGIPNFSADDLQARHALVEGEAVLMMARIIEKLNPNSPKLSNSDDVSFFLGNLDHEIPAMASKLGVPAEIVSSTLFSYQYGYPFARALWAKDGARALKKAFFCPPSSTREIMTPQVYFERVKNFTQCTPPSALENIQHFETVMTEIQKSKEARIFRSNMGDLGTQLFVKFHMPGNPKPQWLNGFRQDVMFTMLWPLSPKQAGFIWISQWESDTLAAKAAADFQYMTASILGSKTTPATPRPQISGDSTVWFESPLEKSHYFIRQVGPRVVMGWNILPVWAAKAMTSIAGTQGTKLN